jgi:hypothetical protein
MDILTQRDHVDGEMQRRGRARIAGTATAALFGRFADCPASAGVPCHNGLGCCGDRDLLAEIGGTRQQGQNPRRGQANAEESIQSRRDARHWRVSPH